MSHFLESEGNVRVNLECSGQATLEQYKDLIAPGVRFIVKGALLPPQQLLMFSGFLCEAGAETAIEIAEDSPVRHLLSQFQQKLKFELLAPDSSQEATLLRIDLTGNLVDVAGKPFILIEKQTNKNTRLAAWACDELRRKLQDIPLLRKPVETVDPETTCVIIAGKVLQEAVEHYRKKQSNRLPIFLLADWDGSAQSSWQSYAVQNSIRILPLSWRHILKQHQYSYMAL